MTARVNHHVVLNLIQDHRKALGPARADGMVK